MLAGDGSVGIRILGHGIIAGQQFVRLDLRGAEGIFEVGIDLLLDDIKLDRRGEERRLDTEMRPECLGLPLCKVAADGAFGVAFAAVVEAGRTEFGEGLVDFDGDALVISTLLTLGYILRQRFNPKLF